jgi:hypothetical protein
MRCLLAVAFMVGNVASPGKAETVWSYEYSVGENANQLTSCQAVAQYSNGTFAVRVYGEMMDFFFYHQELAVPPGEQLGNVVLSIKDAQYILPAGSGSGTQAGSSSALFFTPDKADYAAILGGLRFGLDFDIIFPDGTSYIVGLKGSDQAILQAFTCWKEKPTGPAGKNPFVGGETSSAPTNNPFN